MWMKRVGRWDSHEDYAAGVIEPRADHIDILTLIALLTANGVA
jgi:hypothetical protein